MVEIETRKFYQGGVEYEFKWVEKRHHLPNIAQNFGTKLITYYNLVCSNVYPEKIFNSKEILRCSSFKLKNLDKDDSISIHASDDFLYLDTYTLTWQYNDGTTRKDSVDLRNLAIERRKESRTNFKKSGMPLSSDLKGRFGFQVNLTRRNYIKVKLDHCYYSN